jgi:hypothetical protein
MSSHRKGKEWVPHRHLMRQVKDLAYDFGKQTGILHMAPGNWCHMPGCTDLFERIGDWRAMLSVAR